MGYIEKQRGKADAQRFLAEMETGFYRFDIGTTPALLVVASQYETERQPSR